MSDTATEAPEAPAQVPLVDYLVLGDSPHLVANECTGCGARYFDRRNACAKCFGTEFTKVDLPTEGTVETYTIVAFAAPGIPVPFVSAVVDLGGTPVRGNVVNVEPTPENVPLGLPVRLTTFPIGTDDNGTEAISFGFEPTTGAN
ncbi:Zn-ribbon domain-containing OB-fold protein [Desertimonas flava]|uniref:Zn-ribbon domain-containing OB-fold protein n=1 Tax=Desertimonas flava TaxID=2064846 RepID=UPI000E3469F7|nr:OB-fold domain-containing protein [Desertimonas flava]